VAASIKPYKVVGQHNRFASSKKGITANEKLSVGAAAFALLAGLKGPRQGWGGSAGLSLEECSERKQLWFTDR
jgi:hypothetical protein